jgi:AcrR family transcriptional regulator
LATDPRKLKPGELCRLLNSTPLGEVLTDGQFRRQRSRAGFRIGTGSTIDLFRYTAWLIGCRHAPKDSTPDADAVRNAAERHEAARGAATVGLGKSGSRNDEALIAAMLTEPTYTAAAERAGVSPTTLYRRLNDPVFRAAYERARQELVMAAIGRLQASAGDAVDALTTIARKGRRDGDRVRASAALLDHAWKGLSHADLLRAIPDVTDQSPGGTSEVVKVLTARLRQLDKLALPAAEKSRLTVSISDALLRALGVDVIEKRLAAVEGVLVRRKEKR